MHYASASRTYTSVILCVLLVVRCWSKQTDANQLRPDCGEVRQLWNSTASLDHPARTAAKRDAGKPRRALTGQTSPYNGLQIAQLRCAVEKPPASLEPCEDLGAPPVYHDGKRTGYPFPKMATASPPLPSKCLQYRPPESTMLEFLMAENRRSV